ncbi:uncharacterized protein LOC121534626 [Coregonus clupeaformis]|uniref:uncharacterized protein LOC121534626 n=1 Tax=Coregonus clupeaformis TaxID=59861 RepID=UPI001BE12BBE|nr:uncharacterized protein LOC121534626 [Coregonus clupeaformis]XP_041697136.1 uncharacterized protein LOC121534626 [Coregonus clupeaformis]
MAAKPFENGPHGQHAVARPLGPRQPVPQPNPDTRHPVHGPQGPGPHLTEHPPHRVHQPRPYFYVQPMQPPPPPLYHYQWPMPYNPYSGFPGMGYGMPGMVMPPFPPHPYMEAPGYFLPHAQLHPAEYRRYQFPPAAMVYQNHNNRSRTFYQNTTPRETVNSEVQTEPPPEAEKDCAPSAAPLAGSDSGRGTDSTNSTTPSSPSSNAEKQRCPEEEPNSPIASKTGFQGMVRGQGTGTDPPAGTKTIHSRRTSIEELGKPVHGGGHLVHHVWSVCSADGMVPMCSSSDQEDEVIMAERRVSSSFPDVLMGGGSPSSKMEGAPKCGQTLTQEMTHENTTEGYNVVMTGSCEGFPNLENGHYKILKLPFIFHDLMTESKVNESVRSMESMAPYVPSTEWLIQNELMEPEDVAQESSEKVSDDQSQMSFHYRQVPEKLNESVWSVQSLAPYIPSKELLVEKKSDPANVSQGLRASQVMAITERRRSRRFSLTLENLKEAEKMSDENATPCQESFHYSQIQRKANESVWSVQSLAPYVPSREWLIQNEVLDPEEETEKESDVNVSQGLTATQVLAITERRRSQRLSLSSVDSLPPYVPSSCWLADMGNVYYYSKLPLGSEENKHVIRTPMDKFTPSKGPNMNSESLPSSKRESKLRRNLHMEPVEIANVDGSPILLSSKSAMIPSLEGSLNSTQGSLKPKAQCSPNLKAQEITEHRAQSPPCSPDDPETYASKCMAGDKESVYSCPGPCNQEMETEEKEPAVPSRQGCEQLITDVRMLTAPSSNRHFKVCGLKCSKLQERNCSCQEPKLNVGSFRKSPTGRLNEGNVAPDLLKPQEQQCHISQNQKRQIDSRRANKARPSHESGENGYGPNNNSKKRRPWQNGPPDGTQAQTNPSNSFGQRNTQRNGYQEPCNGYYGRSGKTRGANGKNPRY